MLLCLKLESDGGKVHVKMDPKLSMTTMALIDVLGFSSKIVLTRLAGFTLIKWKLLKFIILIFASCYSFKSKESVSYLNLNQFQFFASWLFWVAIIVIHSDKQMFYHSWKEGSNYYYYTIITNKISNKF